MSLQKSKISKFTLLRQVVRTQAFMTIAGFFAVAFIAAPIAGADSYQSQIDALNAKNSQTQSTVNSLQSQAKSYQDAIDQLNAQISGLQTAISNNQNKQADIQSQIQANQIKLEQQKQILGEDLKAMYVNGQMTTLEELASSKTISDFVNAETYRNAVQSKVQDTLTQISLLQNQLQSQKTQVDQLIALQTQQQTQLDASQSQQTQMLAYNQSQQAA